MARILFINPSKWGRGITPIWIASHSALLKSKGHSVKLFDATFYQDWSIDEVAFNTENKQYKPSDYDQHIKLKSSDIIKDLQQCIETYVPDIIFWSALSSHIHGEGEYVNVQYGYDLVNKVNTTALKITGGLQVTARPKEMLEMFSNVDYFISGETEFVLGEIADIYPDQNKIRLVNGITFKSKKADVTAGEIISNPRQMIIKDMDEIPIYDYSVFEDEIFFRPYNGNVERAVDYELSRGCIYACSYCVETIIQRYYGFSEVNRGTIKNAKGYLRHKSAERVYTEFKKLHEDHGITLVRCQDTNFLTINRRMLLDLASIMEKSDLNIKLYIETRPEGINSASLDLLKKLKVDGIGMGIEVSDEDFRQGSLNRFASQEKIINAFRSLREHGIKRTAYNIIGVPDETEQMILESIKFNQLINPDNITVAFYSPYIGTTEQQKSHERNDFDEYEYHVDGQLRSVSKSTLIEKEVLEFYKKYFTFFVKNGFSELDTLKKKEKIN